MAHTPSDREVQVLHQGEFFADQEVDIQARLEAKGAAVSWPQLMQ